MWATVEQIAGVTGKTVDAITRSLAAQSIELATGLIEAVERAEISDRDLYFLKVAVSYQAAWIAEQPDYLERSDVMAASQDGQSATGTPDWLTLAPLAKRALRRLSWRGNRTLAAGSAPRGVRVNALISDAHGGWTRL